MNLNTNAALNQLLDTEGLNTNALVNLLADAALTAGLPDYPIGSDQNFTSTYGTISNQVVQINKVYGYVGIVNKKVTISSLGLRTVGTAVGNIVMGIYKYTDNGTATGQWDLVEQTDPTSPIDTSVSGMYNIGLTNPAVLDVGVYALCILSSASITANQQIATSVSPFLGHSNPTGTTGYKNIISANFTYNAVMPSQLTSPIGTASSYAPYVVAKVIAPI